MQTLMPERREHDELDRDLYLAGEKVAAGFYKQIGTSREIYLDQEDVLPASLDGRVACYVRVRHTSDYFLG